MAEDSFIKRYFQKNVPITTNENVPLYELGHSTCRRKSIPKKKVEELAIEKYRTTCSQMNFMILLPGFISQ